VLADLAERGFVSAVAATGAGVIHDFELALGGFTSEDVDAALGPGQFGMARETGEWLNGAITAGVARGLGLGLGLGSVAIVHTVPSHRMARERATLGKLSVPTAHTSLEASADTAHRWFS
jgi:hypothetical protein